MFMIHRRRSVGSPRLIAAKKPDVKECERRLLPSQSRPPDAGEVSDA